MIRAPCREVVSHEKPGMFASMPRVHRGRGHVELLTSTIHYFISLRYQHASKNHPHSILLNF